MNDQSGQRTGATGGQSGPIDPKKIDKGDRIKKGGTDPLGDTVNRVLVLTDRFIIYAVSPKPAPDHPKGPTGEKETPPGDQSLLGGRATPSADNVWLRTKYSCDYDAASELRKNLGVIAADLAYVCDVVDSICRSGHLDPGSSFSLRSRATELMARAMEMAYEKNDTGAKELLKYLRKNVTTLRDSKNRMRYVQGNLLALAGILALWVCFWFFAPAASLILEGGPGSFNVHTFDVLALGAVGAFFAVSASVSSIRVDHSVSLWEMLYTGIVRILIGVIAAGVTILLISGDWLLASIQPTLLPWTYLLIGFLAGFSELFVPNALREIEAASTVGAPTNSAPTGK